MRFNWQISCNVPNNICKRSYVYKASIQSLSERKMGNIPFYGPSIAFTFGAKHVRHKKSIF